MDPRINAREIQKVAKNRQVQQRLKRDAEALAMTAARLAPKRTGAGASSIHAEPQSDGSWRVSWGRGRDYMRFSELGTKHQGAKPFLGPAAKRRRRG
jgi:HK97 gp10 family phage protein